jgi:hypothetical protein
MIISASASPSAENMPAWLAWVIGIGGAALLAAALFWIAPPARRREVMTRRVLPSLGFFLVFAGISGPSSGQLVLGGGGFAVGALPVFWMGKLPADLPLAGEPGRGRHPEYPRLVRRGRIAGLAFVVLEIAWIVALVALS